MVINISVRFVSAFYTKLFVFLVNIKTHELLPFCVKLINKLLSVSETSSVLLSVATAISPISPIQDLETLKMKGYDHQSRATFFSKL